LNGLWQSRRRCWSRRVTRRRSNGTSRRLHLVRSRREPGASGDARLPKEQRRGWAPRRVPAAGHIRPRRGRSPTARVVGAAAAAIKATSGWRPGTVRRRVLGLLGRRPPREVGERRACGRCFGIVSTGDVVRRDARARPPGRLRGLGRRGRAADTGVRSPRQRCDVGARAAPRRPVGNCVDGRAGRGMAGRGMSADGDRVHGRRDARLQRRQLPMKDRGWAGRQRLVHAAPQPGPSRRDRGWPGRQPLVHAESEPGPGRADHARWGRDRVHGRRHTRLQRQRDVQRDRGRAGRQPVERSKLGNREPIENHVDGICGT
jgi:hypothetical protein